MAHARDSRSPRRDGLVNTPYRAERHRSPCPIPCTRHRAKNRPRIQPPTQGEPDSTWHCRPDADSVLEELAKLTDGFVEPQGAWFGEIAPPPVSLAGDPSLPSEESHDCPWAKNLDLIEPSRITEQIADLPHLLRRFSRDPQ